MADRPRRTANQVSAEIKVLYHRYRPSNGTEGEIFMERFCFRCTKFPDDPMAPDQCEILGNSFCYEIDDPKYPKEWIANDASGLQDPRCTAFQPRLEGRQVK